MRLATRLSPLLLAAMALAACQAAPVAAPAGQAQPGARTATIMVVPSVAGGGMRRLLAAIAPYDAASIHHLRVELTDDDAPTTVLASARVDQADLFNTITFGNLEHNQAYTVTAKAYVAETEDANTLISIEGSSQVPLAVGMDDRPVLANLVVTLKDRTFSGQADSTGVTIEAGGVTHSGNVAATAHQTLLFTTSLNVDLSGGAATPGAPSGTAVTANGDVYFTDFDRHVVWKLPGGEGPPVLFAGTPDTYATFIQPGPIVVGPDGALYVGDFTTIKRIALPGGAITTIAGNHGDNGAERRPTDAEGSLPDARDARFATVSGLAFTRDGAIVMAEGAAGILRHVVPGGGIRNLCAHGTFGYGGGVAVGRDGKYYMAAPFARQIVRVTDGTPPTLEVFAGTGTSGGKDDTRLQATFQSPKALAFDPAGWLYVGDYTTVRRISPRGDVGTLAGSPTESGGSDGSLFLNLASPGTTRFDNVSGLTVGADGRLHVADADNARLAVLRFGGL